MLLSDGHGYRHVLAKSEERKVHRTLDAVKRHARKVVAVRRALGEAARLPNAGHALEDLILLRLEPLPHLSGGELPPLPNGGNPYGSAAGEPRQILDRDVDESTDFDSLISAAPIRAWKRLASDIGCAEDDETIRSLAWYVGLLLDSAEALVANVVVSRCRERKIAHALHEAGVGDCSEPFVDRLQAELTPADLEGVR